MNFSEKVNKKRNQIVSVQYFALSVEVREYNFQKILCLILIPHQIQVELGRSLLKVVSNFHLPCTRV